jgi:hypothetical protein
VQEGKPERATTMTTFASITLLVPAAQVTPAPRSVFAGPEYCTVHAADQLHARLRDLTPIEAMYAYYGSDEAAA